MPSALADIPESSVPVAAVSSVRVLIRTPVPLNGTLKCMAWKGFMKLIEINDSAFDVKIAPHGKIVRIKEEAKPSSGSRPCVRFEALSGMPD